RLNVPTRFAAGTLESGPTLNQIVTLSGQTHLDMLLLASAFANRWIRKTPGFGFKADKIDFLLNPGTDLSSSIVFEEGINIEAQDTAVTSVADIFAHEVRVQTIPGLADSGGTVTWGRIGSTGDMVLTDAAYDLGVPTFSLLVAYAQQIQNRKAN